MPTDSKQVQAADTLDKEQEPTYSLVEAELENLESLFKKAFKNYAMFMGDDNFEGYLEFNKNVTPESFNQFIETWAAFKDDLSKVDGVREEVVKKAISRLRLNSDKEDELLKNVDKASFEIGNGPTQNGQQQPDHIGDVLNGG